MSKLESEVRPILSKLMFAEPDSAGDAETDLLAAWSFKTLVNASFEAHRRSSALVATKARDHLRERVLPPHEVSLVAFRVDGLDTMIRTRTKDVAIRTPGGRLLDTAIVATVLIGRFAVQMVSHRGAGTPRPARTANLQDAAVTIWPPDARASSNGPEFRWPPLGAVVGDVDFDAVADPDDDAVRSWMP